MHTGLLPVPVRPIVFPPGMCFLYPDTATVQRNPVQSYPCTIRITRIKHLDKSDPLMLDNPEKTDISKIGELFFKVCLTHIGGYVGYK